MTRVAVESALIAELRGIVGDAGLLLGDDAAERSCDPFRIVAPAGGVIVRPKGTAEVAQVLALCSRHGQRVVTHGGRTGVVGGAYAGESEVVLSLERMNRIEELDPFGEIAVVEAGVVLEALQMRAAEEGLQFPVDLGARGSCTIGGMIATNAGGNRVIRWGTTRANILGVEAVLADGTVVSAMNRLIKNNTGYDVKQLLIGSEGTVGVVTRAVVKLVPAPVTQQVAFISLASFEHLLELLKRARRLQILSAFEVMWRDYYALVSSAEPSLAPVAADQPYYVLIEAMGYNAELDQAQFEAFLGEAFEAGLIVDAVTANSSRQIEELWRVREASEVLVREMSPFVPFDVSVEIPRAEAFAAAVREALEATFSPLRCVTLGHLGDNNLHLAVHVGPDTVQRAAEVEACVYRIVREFDGALTAEHGVGQFKREFLPAHVSPGALEVMQRVRGALDPQRLLNRDVLF